MSRFNIGDLVYTYDEQGLIYKNQVLGVVGGFYMLTGRPEPVNTQYVFRTKKECLQAMKKAGIEKKSLHMATVINLENKIADLEAKLSEKEVDLIALDTENYSFKQQIDNLRQQLEDMKASSDKNIDYLIEFASLIEDEKDCNRMLKALDRVKQGKKYIVDKVNQDKISFCVEQLEKVKEFFLEEHRDEEMDTDYIITKDAGQIADYLLDQIKQLKEGK